MLEKIFNTLKVLVQGPDTTEEATLIPTPIFDDRTLFSEAVLDLFEKANIENIYDFLMFVVCVDTQIRYRIDDNTGGYIEGAPIQPNDYLELLNTIDRVFGVSDESFGVNAISGTQHPNPIFSGLSGAVLQLIKENYGDDQYDAFKGFIEFSLEACKTNPSISAVWWLDALNEIYEYEPSETTSEEDQWLDLHGDSDQRETIQIWFMRLTNSIGKLYNAIETSQQNLPESALGTQLLDFQMDRLEEFAEMYEDKFTDGHICEKINLLEDVPSNVEQCLYVCLVNWR